jgi:hemerythrin superfamily protein
MSDAIKMLESDHRKVESLFERCRSSPDPTVVEQICKELTVHSLIEEQVVYPVLEELPDGSKLRREAEKEHQEVKEAILEIGSAGFDPERASTPLRQLMDGVTHHVEEEEREAFPRMRKALGDARLVELGQELAFAKLDQVMTVSDLGEMTKDELYEMARATGVEGRSEMDKDDLIRALEGSRA